MTADQMKRALVVGAQTTLHDAIREVFPPHWSIETASDQDQALGRLAADDYALILLDLVDRPDLVNLLDFLMKRKPEAIHNVVVITSDSLNIITRSSGTLAHGIIGKARSDIGELAGLALELETRLVSGPQPGRVAAAK